MLFRRRCSLLQRSAGRMWLRSRHSSYAAQKSVILLTKYLLPSDRKHHCGVESDLVRRLISDCSAIICSDTDSESGGHPEIRASAWLDRELGGGTRVPHVTT